MNRPSKLLFWVALCLLSLGWASAQGLLEDYRRARGALARSVDVFSRDQVESLDALRRAEAAFAPLLGRLEPSLRRGLAETFARAEAAVVNRSETDLRVQAAVLRGGVQRPLYEGALEAAADGDLPRARALLGVLAADLGLRERQFGGSTPRALQTAFERRLAALSLAQLDNLGDDREGRYETLARLYSHVFLVQDSPRLPERTQAVLLEAIRALVAREPLAPSLETLRAQLTQFGRAAQGPPPDAARAAPRAAPPEAAAQGRNAGTVTGVDPGVAPAPGTRSAPPATPRGTDPALPEQAAPDTQPAALPEPAPARAVPQTAPPQTATAPTSPAEGLVGTLRDPLLIASGLLALTALAQLVRFSRGSPTPWQDAALALLLLPALVEGVLALARAVAPLVGLPFLGTLDAYSLFANPLTQLLWLFLVALAVLCLELGWRAEARTSAQTPAASAPRPMPVGASSQAVSTTPTASGLNWDEDF